MPADLTPEKALDEIRARISRAPITSTTNDLTAILARVTPSETGYCGKGVCAALGGHEGTCAEASGWAHDPLTPTAVPGSGEVEVTEGFVRQLAQQIASLVLHAGVSPSRVPELVADIVSAAITALRDGEVGGE